MSSPSGRPPRSAVGVRDLLGAIALLLLPIALVLGVTRACTFSPGGPTIDPAAGPRVDAAAELRALAPRVPFAVRVPAVPPGWRANAVDQQLIDGSRVVRAGFVTPEGRFVRLVQTDADEAALLAAEGEVPPATGTVEVAGVRWTVLESDRQAPVWVARVDGGGGPPVGLLLTGSGGDAVLRTLAEALAAGEVLPVGTAPG
ncbi:MAG TPA: DUF4245 family protein [Pseudonocardia sp.]|nr:DUF4245 family protein [Pseudonocardia sp.]